MTTGDGGALCCLPEEDYQEARRRRWFGIDRERDQPSLLGEREYDLNAVAFKYHLNDLGAAVGLGNLPDLPGNLARHRKIAATYTRELKGVPGLTQLDHAPDRESSWWMFTVLVERREDFIRALKARGVPSTVVHQGIDRNRIFGGANEKLVNQRYFDAHQVALPVHVGLADEDVESIIQSVRAGW